MLELIKHLYRLTNANDYWTLTMSDHLERDFKIDYSNCGNALYFTQKWITD